MDEAKAEEEVKIDEIFWHKQNRFFNNIPYFVDLFGSDLAF